MSRRDKLNNFKNRITYIFKLLNELNVSILVLCLGLCIINVILSYAPMINTREIINKIQLGIYVTNIITRRLILFLILGVLTILSSSLYNYFMSRYKEYLYLELNIKFLNESLKFDLQDFENSEVYNMIQRAEQEIGIRPYSIIVSSFTIISQFISLLSAFIILTTWHISLVIGFILFACIATKYFIIISKNEYEILMNRTNYERKSWYIAHLLIKDEYIKEVKLFSLSKYLIKEFTKLRNLF